MLQSFSQIILFKLGLANFQDFYHILTKNDLKLPVSEWQLVGEELFPREEGKWGDRTSRGSDKNS